MFFTSIPSPFLIPTFSVVSCQQSRLVTACVNVVSAMSRFFCLNANRLFSFSLWLTITFSHNVVIGEECPLVPFNEKQEMALNSAIFVSLLHELHLHLPDQQENCLYPRVPTSLSPSDILEMCLKLAPIDESLLNPKYMDNSSKRTATNRGANISDQSC